MNIRLEKSRLPQHLLKYFETDTCSSCYVCHTIEILREVRRVLRKDGVVFWNIGDSYFAKPKSNYGGKAAGLQSKNYGTGETELGYRQSGGKFKSLMQQGYKNKDLCLIPFRVAIAAQTDGWWVRSIIIWNKPNPMPESVNDRPTTSHEYILMLTKSARYYWDQEAVRETGITGDMRRPYTSKGAWELDGRAESQRHGGELRDSGAANGRNLRSVWSFPTQPYPEAHFAVFPEKLPELCIKAATPEAGCCAECGAPWHRIVESKFIPQQDVRDPAKLKKGSNKGMDSSNTWGETPRGTNEVVTIGWLPTCKCNADKVPSIALDPFLGAGTTLKVAKKLNRRAIGFDTSEEYCQLAVKRCRQTMLEI